MKKEPTATVRKENGDTLGMAYLIYLQTIADRSAP
jgi:hypothetical protein